MYKTDYGYYRNSNIHEAPEKLQEAVKNPEKQCVLCGRKTQENEEEWKTIMLSHYLMIYICPDEFPPDDEASVDTFKRVYMKAIRKAWYDKS